MNDKIHSLAKKVSEKPIKTVAMCYIALILLCATAHMIIGIATKIACEKAHITLSDFHTENIEIIEDVTALSLTNDPQMIISGKIVNLYVKCDFSSEKGEMVAFYNKYNNDGFSPAKMVHAQQQGDYYVFRFPLGTKQIRFDMCAYENVEVYFDDIIINNDTFSDIYRLTVGSLFYIAVMPMIVSVILLTVCEFITEKGKK